MSELESIAQVLGNLPDNIEHLSIFEDIETGGVVFSCRREYSNSLEKLIEVYKQHVYDGTYDESIENIRRTVYDLALLFIENDGDNNYIEFKEKFDKLNPRNER